MTENEYKHLRNLVFSEKPYDHKEEQAIIKIFEEIQAYRAIGTVEEFKALGEKEERFDRNIKMFNEIGLEIRNKTIDEFAEECKKRVAQGELYDYVRWCNWNDSVDKWFDRIAEQMKGE